MPARDDKSSAEHDKYATKRLNSTEKAQNLTSRLDFEYLTYLNTVSQSLISGQRI